MDQALARLERVTERLERLESSRVASFNPQQPAAASAYPLPAASPAAAPTPAPAPAQSATGNNGPASWTQLLASHMTPLAQLTSGLGDEVLAAFLQFKQAFEAVGRVLEVASIAQKPDPGARQTLLHPVAQHMAQLGKLAEGRRTDAFNHIKALSESIQALSWLAYTDPSCGLSPPPQHVADSWQSADFFTTRVLKEHRDKDPAHAAWVRALKELMVELEALVTRSYPTGLVWASTGGLPLQQALQARPQAAAAVAAAAATPGPPPPPLTLDKFQQERSKGAGVAGAGEGMSALFRDIAGGQGLASGLKKVTDDMKTKNRTDRTAVVTMPEKKPLEVASRGPGSVPSGTSCLELRDRKWYAEYQVGNKAVEIIVTDPKHSVYVYACKDSLITIKGKVNNISLDSCVKTGVKFDDVIASFEVVNCKGVQLQTLGMVPTISVEKTDGCQLYLSEPLTADPNFQIVTAKCSAMNVVVTDPQDLEKDPLELPIPEQFISSFQGGKLITVAAAHSGA